jgi:hypothetical protein
VRHPDSNNLISDSTIPGISEDEREGVLEVYLLMGMTDCAEVCRNPRHLDSAIGHGPDDGPLQLHTSDRLMIIRS